MLLQLTQILSEQQVCHISQPLYDWRATENSIAYQGGAKPWLSKVAQSTIVAHLKSFGLKEASVIPNQQGPGFVCQWQSSWEPIEVIIPTHTNINGLKTCLAGLLQLTDYLKLTITIVGNRCSSEVNEFLNTLQSQVQIRIVFDDSEFNWARLNNRIAKESKAPFLLFLNDDVEIKNAYWLRDLRRYLDLFGVGAVGATLFYPNGELQHNGIYTDFLKIATNITEWGKMDELRVTRNVSAVTGACLLTKQKVWEQVGGFEERLAVSYNDVDFCLALRAQNLRIVQATDVELIHHEHATYGTIDNIKKQTKWQQEAQLMRDKWSEHLKELYFPHYEVLIQQTRILHVP
ncbi:glycosyl transferase, group 2 family [Beggiatoa sp. PS]|nr:glycosyl transferase, group 2 family [Beggiatoa sp. PS]